METIQLFPITNKTKYQSISIGVKINLTSLAYHFLCDGKHSWIFSHGKSNFYTLLFVINMVAAALEMEMGDF